MAMTVMTHDAAPNADERAAALAVAPDIPDTAERRFVVLRRPSGGSGGATSDIVVYKNIAAHDIGPAGPDGIPVLASKWARDPDAEQLGTLDVYTPERQSAQSVIDGIQRKTRQAAGVCVNSRHLDDRSFAALQAACAAQPWAQQFVVLVRDGATTGPVYGARPPYWRR
ncbi:hypothetical protein SAMN05216371_7981 [Streptomyces sp. TLI_053]|uniref:hypothetical protein n=1 Tax=Streptomyces sp. TLI_053 TaxID=1855352 RepID=UPI00087C3566|nr:hypothetical protein [Streptomyces sp. TLI_053]SDT83168.1 hypothetical protein SAMN05216371_7981 [Streptomyces sp. TLI_053]